MKHSLSLRTICESESEKKQLIELFNPEDKKLNNNRAEYTITEDELSINFNVEATDAVALRAMITSITKTLDVFERTTKIIKGEEK